MVRVALTHFSILSYMSNWLPRMMPAEPPASGAQANADDLRIQSLFAVIDLVGRDTRIDEFLCHLAVCLRPVVDFDLLGVVLPRDEWATARLHAVRLASPDAVPAAADVHSIAVAPLDKERLAAAAEDRQQRFVLDRLDAAGEYSEVAAALSELGQRSASLLPLATALGPVGLIGFGSSREGTYRQGDISFLQHIARQVAVGIDNVRHQEEALARERQLQAERDHLRGLLELTNDVVTTRVSPRCWPQSSRTCSVSSRMMT